MQNISWRILIVLYLLGYICGHFACIVSAKTTRKIDNLGLSQRVGSFPFRLQSGALIDEIALLSSAPFQVMVSGNGSAMNDPSWSLFEQRAFVKVGRNGPFYGTIYDPDKSLFPKMLIRCNAGRMPRWIFYGNGTVRRGRSIFGLEAGQGRVVDR
ncbi:hypothetical protein K3X41_06510 [Aliiroseovarius crassostreae]|uniref:hypothetical protein n=1 Tax=Aliiroseovarius crassostreae TaxID=154981 RepID=UPI0022081B5B|nr:hypothetical protein [Aliiroseovarius crassostreae]UWQ09629.1 hypothetical protein K3X25_06655 [Aliiroseovarius crassostreae]UWQ12726.1 hypothetical protein K3X41_06510 [Aliiroseovarius crassostreae]